MRLRQCVFSPHPVPLPLGLSLPTFLSLSGGLQNGEAKTLWFFFRFPQRAFLFWSFLANFPLQNLFAFREVGVSCKDVGNGKHWEREPQSATLSITELVCQNSLGISRNTFSVELDDQTASIGVKSQYWGWV
jgi:hypothetical protein